MARRKLALAEDRQRRMLASAVHVAQRLGIQREHLVVAGGAALQARWKHRSAHGVWLFAKTDHWIHASDAIMDGHHEELVQEASGTDPVTRLNAYSLRWATPDGPVGIYAEPVYRCRREGEAEDEDTGIGIASPSEALSRKSLSKMESLNQFHLRDAVDIIAAARHDPKAIRSLGWLRGETTCNEIFWQAKLLGDPQETRIKQAAVACLKALAMEQPVPTHPDLELPDPPQPAFRPDPETRHSILPLERFDHPELCRPQPLVEPLDIMIRKNMAGHPLSPTGKEVQGWLLSQEPPEEGAQYLSEALQRATGHGFSVFRQGCGASLYDIARILRQDPSWTGERTCIHMNQYVRLAEGDNVEIADANAWPFLK